MTTVQALKAVKESDYKIIPVKEHIKVGKSFTNTYAACYIMHNDT